MSFTPRIYDGHAFHAQHYAASGFSLTPESPQRSKAFLWLVILASRRMIAEPPCDSPSSHNSKKLFSPRTPRRSNLTLDRTPQSTTLIAEENPKKSRKGFTRELPKLSSSRSRAIEPSRRRRAVAERLTYDFHVRMDEQREVELKYIDQKMSIRISAAEPFGDRVSRPWGGGGGMEGGVRLADASRGYVDDFEVINITMGCVL